MPMFTMSVMRLPVNPVCLPLRTFSENASHLLEHALHLRHDVLAVDDDGAAESLRSAT